MYDDDCFRIQILHVMTCSYAVKALHVKKKRLSVSQMNSFLIIKNLLHNKHYILLYSYMYFAYVQFYNIIGLFLFWLKYTLQFK